jgi:hypothetical protein
LALIVLGVLLLVQQNWPNLIDDWAWPLGLGLLLLVGYLLTRQYGFLIPGCILTGLGIPLALIESNTISAPADWPIVLGLGLGFIAIWVIDSLVRRGRPVGWWPLIPGGILTAVAVGIASENEAWLEDIGRWWPLILIVLGVWVLFERFVRRQT